MRSKRGEESSSLVTASVWSLLIVMLGVLVPFSDEIVNINNDMAVEKKAVAKDIALTADALLAAPDRVDYLYPRHLFNFSVRFLESEIIVTDETGRTNLKPHKSGFSSDEGAPISEKVISWDREKKISIGFFKDADSLSAYPEPMKQSALLKDCFGAEGDLYISNPIIGTLVLDEINELEGGSGRVGGFVGSLREQTRVSDHVFGVVVTQAKLPIEENPVKVYVPFRKEKSAELRRLGCLVLNRVLDEGAVKDAIDSGALGQFTSSSVIETDGYKIMDEEFYTIIVVLGNSMAGEGQGSALSEPRLAQQVVEAVERGISDHE